MVQLVEITGVLNEKGCIEIPIVLLAQTGIRTGEEVNLIYLAAGEKDYRNESREFMLKRAEEDPLEELQSGETELKLPPQLLADAHIPLDADLDIVCLDRKIVILPTEDVESEDVPKELLDICADLGIPREKVNIVLRMTEEEKNSFRCKGRSEVIEMKKPVYKLLDEKGRVLIPLEMRQKAEIEKGDILKVSINTGKIVISKVDILEVGKQDAEAVEAYVHAAVKTMSHEKQVALAARILKLAQQEGGADC